MVLRSLFLAALMTSAAGAQWFHVTVPGTPRTPDGKPNLNAPTPRLADGHPDLSGIWSSSRPPRGDAGKAGENPSYDLTNYLPEGQTIPLNAEGKALYQHRLDTFGVERPTNWCMPHGIPDAMLIPMNYKIVQTPGMTAILYEEFNHYRQIFTDGRALPKEQNPAWFGYSVGKWDGDTFVVDTVGFNDQTWLDNYGHPHSEGLHTTERFTRTDFGHMKIDLTVDDPKYYSKPFTATIQFRINADTEMIENICENERDQAHYLKVK